MAYQFAGFLVPTDQDLATSAAMPGEAICRLIVSPFLGVGIRLPSLIGKTPSVSQIHALASEFGVIKARSWLYIGYETWGRVDSVYAAGVHEGTAFGPIDDSNIQTVEATFVEVMSRIGVNREQALRFDPFRRGFWAPQA
ncbi:hypothetical protein J2W30_005884 [Variovorax boronicumulans]|uniref:hypothetical protein n=1 Tax=Variovorax TaxID=34072 RepID=UPI00277D409A|nr:MULTISPECIES: hypothetical protein [Variovorax]MDQ0038097.1 hypothetical protein [Variovorax boronicumulans]MDQ0606240.1 hypothetical protein [Variovorax sp. W1I1]